MGNGRLSTVRYGMTSIIFVHSLRVGVALRPATTTCVIGAAQYFDAIARAEAGAEGTKRWKQSAKTV